MLFDHALDDYSSKTVMDYLLSKHTIDAAPVDHVNTYLRNKEKTPKEKDSAPIVKDGKVTLRRDPASDTKDVSAKKEDDVAQPPNAPVVKPIPVQVEDVPVDKSKPKSPSQIEQHESPSVKEEKPRHEAPQEEESPINPKENAVVNVCSGNEDPFKGTNIYYTRNHTLVDQAIETFKPPRNAPLAEVMEWEDAVRDLKTRIAKMNVGGKTLRDLIWKEVRALQLKRFHTFCKYV